MAGGIASRKYVMLISFTAVLLIVLYLSPQLISSSLTTVKTIAVTKKSIKSTVSCAGTIEAVEQQSLYYAMALKPKKIRVSIGDTVKAGQRLIDIDKDQTVQAMSEQQGDSTGTNGTSEASASEEPSVTEKYKSYAANMNPADYNSLVSYYRNQNSSAVSDSSSAASSQGEKTGLIKIPSFINSPISGVITELNAENDEFTNPKKPVAVITNINKLRIKAQVDEIYIANIKKGQSVEIRGDGFKSVYEGVVSSIFPTARKITSDTDSRTVVDIYIDVKNPDKNLKPGLSANADIIISDILSLTVPYEAVQEDASNKEYIYLCRNGKACKQYVQTGKEYNNSVEIINGLKQNDTVVINPPATLKSGQFVKQLKQTGGTANG